jgi:hypothetical protein
MFNIITKDYGPGTKLLGLFENNNILSTIEPDTYLVLVDDDLIYKPYMLQHFEESIKDSSSHNLEIGSYYVYRYGDISIGQGADGFFMKWDTLQKFMCYYEIIKGEDYLFYHDDFFISYYFHLLNKCVYYIKSPNDTLIYDLHPNSTVDALSRLSGKYSRENLNIQSNEILTGLYKMGSFSDII